MDLYLEVCVITLRQTPHPMVAIKLELVLCTLVPHKQ